MFLPVITGFTTGNHIAFIAFPAPGKRHDVIHGQILRAAFLLTIIADTRSQLVMPTGKNFVKLLFHGPAAKEISTQAAALARAREVLMIIGPEGGFSPEEIEFLSGHDCQVISLGSNILRLETATIAATAIVQYLTVNQF